MCLNEEYKYMHIYLAVGLNTLTIKKKKKRKKKNTHLLAPMFFVVVFLTVLNC